MKTLILIILLITPSISFSQSIVWEAEYDLGEPAVNSYFPLIQDSDGNLVFTVMDSKRPLTSSYFLKYDTLGNLLSFRDIYNGNLLLPLNLSETGFGYRIFSATHPVPMYSIFDNMMPMIVNVDKKGDTINIETPYNIYDPGEFNDRCFNLILPNNPTIEKDGFFYIASRKKGISHGESQTMKAHHTILSCYDSSGKVAWRNGYDTLGGNAPGICDSYWVYDFKLTHESTFLILLRMFRESSSERLSRIKILETDFEGNLLKSIVLPEISPGALVEPKSIIKCEDGSYIVLFYHFNTEPRKYYLWKVSPDGDLIKSLEFPLKYLHRSFYGMKKAPDGSFIVHGKYLVEEHPTRDGYDDDLIICMLRFNEELECLWEFEWYPHIRQDISLVKDILFLDNNDFIVTGHKDRFKTYIARIKADGTGVEDAKSGANVKVSIQPSPFSSLCEIKIESPGRERLSVGLYDVLGNKIRSVHESSGDGVCKRSILFNGTGLPSGAYFLMVRCGDETICRQVIKAE